MSEQMIGISNYSFDDLLLQFYKLKEELNISLNEIRVLIQELEQHYNCQSGKDFINKFETFANNNFNQVLDNFDSYINDLKSARENIERFDAKLLERIIEEKLN